MGKFRRLKTLMQFETYGGTLSFEHKKSKQVYTIDISPRDYKVIRKMLRTKDKYFLLMDNSHNLKLYKALDTIAQAINEPAIELGELYIKEKMYVVLNRELFMHYIDTIKIVKTTKRNHQESDSTNTPQASSRSESLWSSIQKKPAEKQVRFDWYEHYLEGMRMHGNKDDAEAHADAMRKKISGRSHL